MNEQTIRFTRPTLTDCPTVRMPRVTRYPSLLVDTRPFVAAPSKPRRHARARGPLPSERVSALLVGWGLMLVTAAAVGFACLAAFPIE